MDKKDGWKAACGIGLFAFLAWNEFNKFKKELKRSGGREWCTEKSGKNEGKEH
ncbi:hypothetical protein [Metabacillus sp. 84]|uniref:hypothetical protein n=1 Tax=unclassified Metabacillus TaxID=2675274 RepID=UPI003CF56E10